MRIGIVSIYPRKGKSHDYQGGVAWYTKNLVNSLAKENPKNQLVVIANKIDGKEEVYYEQKNKVKIIRTWDKNWLFYKKILAAARKEGIDLIHLQHEFHLYGKIYTMVSFIYLLFRLKKMGIKTIVTLHGVVSQTIIDKNFIRENSSRLPIVLTKFGFYLVFKLIGQYAFYTIVHELLFKNILVEEYHGIPQHVFVIPLGVENLKPQISQKQAREQLNIHQQNVILFMGYVTGYKSPELLLEAFLDYSKEDKDCLLIITGGKHPGKKNDPQYLRRYNSLLLQSQKIDQNQIRWLGFIPEEDIEKVVMASNLMIFPYTVAISSSGPLSFALSYKKPFLVSQQLGQMFSIPEIVFNDKNDLSKKIKSFFNRQIKIDDFLAAERKKRLWKNIAKKTLALYNRLITK